MPDNNPMVVAPGKEPAAARQLQVSGVITAAADNTPLPGVNIVEKGTKNGVVSDINGRYSLTVTGSEAILVFSFVGYLAQEVRISGQNTIDVNLVEDIQKLDEVVVIGYGMSKKSDLTTASISVSGDDIKGNIGANLDQALQGRAAGVTAVYTSGQPGSAMSIRIRGQGSLRADASEPLYVIDGVPVQNVSQSGHAIGLGDALGNGSVQAFSGLAGINPSDILTMEILEGCFSNSHIRFPGSQRCCSDYHQEW